MTKVFWIAVAVILITAGVWCFFPSPTQPPAPHVTDTALTDAADMPHSAQMETIPTPVVDTSNQKHNSTSPQTNDSPFGTLGQFENFIDQLPTVAELQKLGPKDLHHPPPLVYGSGRILGKVNGRLKQDPSAIPEGMAFYDRCAQSSDIVSAVRAVCLSNLRYWAKRTKSDDTIDPQRYSEHVRRLADSLPPPQ